MSPLLLGIDVGTSVVKSILFDADGNELASASQESTLLRPHPAWVEQDMEATWQAVAATVRAVVAQARPAPSAIAAIGITGQGDGTWLVDERHAPVRPAILWLDGRTGDLVQAAHRDGLSAEIFAITGTALNTSNQALQLQWLAANEPDSLAAAHAALRAKDWIFLRMTGVVSTDETDASHTYFAADRRCYEPRVLQLMGISHLSHLLPRAAASSANLAFLRPEVAAQLGLAPDTPVAAGPFDVAATDLGCGVLQPGDACTILGTAGIHQMVIAAPVAEPVNTGYTMCHAPTDRLVRLLPSMTGTLNLQWFVREVYGAELAAANQDGRDFFVWCETQAAAVELGCQGVMYHPYIDPAGERSPFVRPDARAQFTGISVNHTRAALLRAVYEGVVLSAMDCYGHLGMPVRELTLAGGGARSPFWCQMFADALGCPVAVVEGSEYGARGAALNAGVAIGVYASYEQAVARTVRAARSYVPRAAAVTAEFAGLLDLYRHTYQAMFPIWAERDARRRESHP